MPVNSGGGPSASASSVRAGGAYYEIVGRDGMSKTIDQLQTKLLNFDKIIKRVGGLSVVGGFLGGLAGGATLTGVLTQAGQKVADWVRGTKEIEQWNEQVVKQLQEARAVLEDNSRLAREWRGAMTEPGDIILSLDAEINALERARAKLGERIHGSPEMREALRRGDVAFFAAGGGVADAAITPEQQKAVRDELARLDKEIRDLLTRRLRVDDPTADPAFVGAINKATKALQDQVLVWGMTGRAAQRAMFAAGGATDVLLEKFDRLDAELARLDTLAKDPPPWLAMILGAAGEGARLAMPQDLPPWLSGAVNAASAVMGRGGGMFQEFLDFRQQLQDAIDFPGSTADEARIRAMERAGLPDAQSRAIRALMPEKLPPWMSGALNVIGAVSDKLVVAAREVRGAFSASSASQRFGFGSTVQQAIADNTRSILEDQRQGLADRVGSAVAVSLVLR